MSSIAIEPLSPDSYVAFKGTERVALGNLSQIAERVKEFIGDDLYAPILIFQNDTGAQIDLDLRGTLEEIRQRHAPVEEARPGPGRPKLGVTPREVTLLPRHWEWLNAQPGGASVALRKLVEEARKANARPEQVRRAKEATYRFASVVAGHLPNFEEASRAIYAGDETRLINLIADWPVDVRQHIHAMALPIFA